MSESISHISSFSILFPLLLSLLYFRNLRRPFKILAILVLLGTFFEAAFYLLRGEFTMLLLNTYTIVELVLISIYFYFSLEKRIFKQIDLLLLLIFVLVSIVSTLFYYDIDINNPATLLTESIIILTLVFLNFAELNQRDIDNYYALGDTWLIIGLFFYFGGNIFTFSYSSDYFSESQSFKFDVWLTHSLINIVLNICLGIAFYIEGRKGKFVE